LVAKQMRRLSAQGVQAQIEVKSPPIWQRERQ